ncbi:helix-turn-helix transcriptional regulator [Micromonospora chersina]|uniref:helix-turn-helix transcriptional regulator n=1 Tax=Micromonospora chersina TaxID=47854 RepID=UPI00371771F2
MPCLPDLADALWRDRRVRVRYVRDGRTATRKITRSAWCSPATGIWWRCATGRRRTYRVSRMRAVDLIDEPATHPPGFDLAVTRAESRRALEHEAVAVEVTVRVAAAALPRLRRLVPVPGKDRVPVTATGEVELTVPFENLGCARSALPCLGSAAKVLAPSSCAPRWPPSYARYAH